MARVLLLIIVLVALSVVSGTELEIGEDSVENSESNVREKVISPQTIYQQNWKQQRQLGKERDGITILKSPEQQVKPEQSQVQQSTVIQVQEIHEGKVHHRKEAPQSYKFGYEVDDEYHGHQYRHEQKDNEGTIHGRFGYRDNKGQYRQVDYVADDHGFRANVKTNEPGVENQDPADVNIRKNYENSASKSPQISHSPQHNIVHHEVEPELEANLPETAHSYEKESGPSLSLPYYGRSEPGNQQEQYLKDDEEETAQETHYGKEQISLPVQYSVSAHSRHTQPDYRQQTPREAPRNLAHQNGPVKTASTAVVHRHFYKQHLAHHEHRIQHPSEEHHEEAPKSVQYQQLQRGNLAKALSPSSDTQIHPNSHGVNNGHLRTRQFAPVFYRQNYQKNQQTGQRHTTNVDENNNNNNGHQHNVYKEPRVYRQNVAQQQHTGGQEDYKIIYEQQHNTDANDEHYGNVNNEPQFENLDDKEYNGQVTLEPQNLVNPGAAHNHDAYGLQYENTHEQQYAGHNQDIQLLDQQVNNGNEHHSASGPQSDPKTPISGARVYQQEPQYRLHPFVQQERVHQNPSGYSLNNQRLTTHHSSQKHLPQNQAFQIASVPEDRYESPHNQQHFLTKHTPVDDSLSYKLEPESTVVKAPKTDSTYGTYPAVYHDQTVQVEPEVYNKLLSGTGLGHNIIAIPVNKQLEDVLGQKFQHQAHGKYEIKTDPRYVDNQKGEIVPLLSSGQEYGNDQGGSHLGSFDSKKLQKGYSFRDQTSSRTPERLYVKEGSSKLPESGKYANSPINLKDHPSYKFTVLLHPSVYKSIHNSRNSYRSTGESDNASKSKWIPLPGPRYQRNRNAYLNKNNHELLKVIGSRQQRQSDGHSPAHSKAATFSVEDHIGKTDSEFSQLLNHRDFGQGRHQLLTTIPETGNHHLGHSDGLQESLSYASSTKVITEEDCNCKFDKGILVPSKPIY